MDNLKKILPTLLLGVAIFLVVKSCQSGGDKNDASSSATLAKQLDSQYPIQLEKYDINGKLIPTPKTAETLGSLDPKSGYKIKVDLTSEQAGIRSIKLTDYFQTIEDKQLFNKTGKNFAEYQKLAAKDPKTYKGNYNLISTVERKHQTVYTLGTKNVSVNFIGDKNPPKYNLLLNWQQGSKGNWERSLIYNRNWKFVNKISDKELQAVTYELPFNVLGSKKVEENGKQVEKTVKYPLLLRKTYTLRKDSYNVEVKLELINKTSFPVAFNLVQEATAGLLPESDISDKRIVAYGYLDDDKAKVDKEYDQSDLDDDDTKFDNWKKLGSSDSSSKPGMWIGETNKFFGAMVYLKPEGIDNSAEGSALVASKYDADFCIQAIRGNNNKPSWQTGIKLNEIKLPAATAENPAPSKTFTFEMFAGPKTRELLGADDALYKNLGYLDTLNTSSCFMRIPFLTRGLMWLLNFLGKLTTNYGIAIMILVGLVRLLLHPLAKRGQINMALAQKKMAALGPKIEKIKEKYKDNQQMASMEQMKLTREAGVFKGQLMGCLPMLLQMPIWISLFSGLSSEVTLRHASFLPFWITDLSAPDALASWGADLWLIGPSFNLLPILLGIAMYYQSKLNPSMNAAGQTPEQQQQQKMMKILMPVMMLFFFYKMPSGLTLYIMSSTIIGAIEQKRIRKYIKEHQEILEKEEAEKGVVVAAPGKASRDARPKKAKGANWYKKP